MRFSEEIGYDGQEIAAVIAAENLTPAAQSHVSSILGVPTDRIAAAMEAASHQTGF